MPRCWCIHAPQKTNNYGAFSDTHAAIQNVYEKDTFLVSLMFTRTCSFGEELILTRKTKALKYPERRREGHKIVHVRLSFSEYAIVEKYADMCGGMPISRAVKHLIIEGQSAVDSTRRTVEQRLGAMEDRLHQLAHDYYFLQKHFAALGEENQSLKLAVEDTQKMAAAGYVAAVQILRVLSPKIDEKAISDSHKRLVNEILSTPKTAKS